MSEFTKLVEAELSAARKQHGNLNSAHESYSVILEDIEEYEELLDEPMRDVRNECSHFGQKRRKSGSLATSQKCSPNSFK
jgi:hypothetical protein